MLFFFWLFLFVHFIQLIGIEILILYFFFKPQYQTWEGSILLQFLLDMAFIFQGILLEHVIQDTA